MQRITAYWKQFVGWATVWYRKYQSDFFVRTTTHIVVLQTGFAIISILAFWFVLQYTNRETLEYLVRHIQDIISNTSAQSADDVTGAVAQMQTRAVWFIFAGIIAIATVFGVVTAKFTLKPARDTLRKQKLFISNVAHELRTPLSSIKTLTEVALLDEELNPEVKKTMHSIVKELNRIAEIVNNLLSLDTFSRPERMKFSDVDMGEVVRDVVRKQSALAKERGIKIILKMDPYRVVYGNPAALEQIISNLLKNAINYTPKDQDGVVTISIHPDFQGHVLISIADTGIGIAQEDLFHIFEPFYRADSSRTRHVKQTGSGLGLSIVNELVRAHHGRITIQSTLRRGTTVSVSFPSGKGKEQDPAPSDTPRASEITVDFSRNDS